MVTNAITWGKCICHVNPELFVNEAYGIVGGSWKREQNGITCSYEADISERAPATRKIHLISCKNSRFSLNN